MRTFVFRESSMHHCIALYVICVTASINGLLSGASVLAEAHSHGYTARNLHFIALTFRVVGFCLLFLLVGAGPIKKAGMRVMVWGYLAGIFTALVSCFCLFNYAVIVDDRASILSTNFFSLWSVLLLGLFTGLALLCLKTICTFLGVLNTDWSSACQPKPLGYESSQNLHPIKPPPVSEPHQSNRTL